MEELGWTGFAVPTLLRRMRYGVLSTGLIVGVLWAALHFLVFFWMGRPSGALPLAIFFVSLFAWLPAYRVLVVWAQTVVVGTCSWRCSCSRGSQPAR